jgi:DNA-binding transcriptional regulator YhcF (GntR family)
MQVIDKIIILKENPNLSKHEQLVQGVIDAIEENELTVGDQLPSINNMVEEIGFARKTIFRAYEELKERGLIESRKLKGYFVISQETNVTLRMALLLFAFQSFQEEFYNTLRSEMGKRYQIDVFFHHNNVSIFETIMANINGKYGMYVIAPIQNEELKPLLKSIAPSKLLMVDRYLPLGPDYSFISQEFEDPIYNALVQLLPEISKYKKFILFFSEETEHSPLGIQRAFERFLVVFNIDGGVKYNYDQGSVKPDYLYFILSDTVLWQVLRDCVRLNYTIGKDIGILSQDDNVAKEFVYGGITTISTDFKEMAKRAARHIKNGDKIQKIMPSNLMKRKSL